MNLAFAVAKFVLSNVPTLVYPDTSGKVSLSVNASGSHIEAVLQQDFAGSWAPLAFYSKKLSSTKSRYSALTGSFLQLTPLSSVSSFSKKVKSLFFSPTTNL